VKILLGVCGGIAAYKAAALTSTLVQNGADVHVILTDGAQRFMTPLTFAALTRNHVHTSLWDEQERIPHIQLVREADVLAIVPATANTIAKLAHGIADDLLTNAALAATIPIAIAPAMNAAMYEHAATMENLRTLRARGVYVIEPESGFLAEREHGVGRLADEAKIIAAIESLAARHDELRGERVVITAGPTREPIDPVRFVSNASTGTTGIELAREALARGAKVDLVLGPTSIDPPAAATTHHVTTAQEMFEATTPLAKEATIVVGTAAVADWRPAHAFAQKLKKEDRADESLELVRTPDIIASIGAHKNGTYVVGFAAETQSHEVNAREKLRSKNLDAIAVNDVAGERGFGTGENELVLLYGKDGRIPLGRTAKRELAIRFWDAIATIRKERS